MDHSRIFKMSFAGVYPYYITEAEKKDEPRKKLTPSFVG
jgi:hypothetical protein